MTQRTIKFRAWDKDAKRMLFTDDWNLEALAANYSEWRWLNLEWMQFTGLTDKNGRDGFDKDIVRLKFTFSHEGSENHGWYHDGYWRVDCDTTRGTRLSFLKLTNDDKKNQFPVGTPIVGFSKDDNTRMAIEYGKYNEYSDDLEVIGNVFENPELLSTQKE